MRPPPRRFALKTWQPAHVTDRPALIDRLIILVLNVLIVIAFSCG
jgi:hypothetical protein